MCQSLLRITYQSHRQSTTADPISTTSDSRSEDGCEQVAVSFLGGRSGMLCLVSDALSVALRWREHLEDTAQNHKILVTMARQLEAGQHVKRASAVWMPK